MKTITPDDAKPGCCQECVMGAPFYFPCNKPAVKMIGWPKRGESYRMCAMCADHNTRNRGASDMGPVDQKEAANG